MTTSPTISVAATTGILERIAASGGNPDRVLAAAGVQRAVLGAPDRFIPSSAFARLLEEAAGATGDACFGLHFGEHFDPKDIGALAYLVVNSPSIAIAIENIERYIHIHNNAARVSFAVEGQRGYLRYVVAGLNSDATRQQNEYSMAIIVKAFRLLAAHDWAPLQIEFAHTAPDRNSEHLRAFRCPVLFGGAANALVIEHDFVQRLVSAADERLYRILKQHVERILSEMPRDGDLLASVRRAIVESMAVGALKRDLIAKRVSMSARTLERRLKEHGVVYKNLVSDTRRQFALGYLKDRGRTITEVAFLLGYSEVSAFNRAFKRWTGVSPLEYREPRAR